jgi:hypothetical protein
MSLTPWLPLYPLGKPAIINMYTLVIQEYFQERVKAWLDTVGKELFGIKHHWLRYEFAPSRGQIHAHMIVICNNKDVVKNCLALKHDRVQLASYLSSWLEDTLGMTASLNESYARLDIKTEAHPLTHKFSDVMEEDLEKHLALCQLSVQKHKCSKYCMRAKPGSKSDKSSREKSNRWCRCGAGVEKTYGKCDTPGFKPRPSAAIVHDPRGFDRVDMPWNNRFIVQASSFLCQGWQGNCDLQYLLYSSDGNEVDAADISRVTNYIVSYSCKGNETEIQEKGVLKSIILSAVTEHRDDRDVKKMACCVLNEASKSRVISKQEAICQLAGLDLFSCSEVVKTESLAGEYKIGTGKEAQHTLLARYAKRDGNLHTMNLYDFFDHWYNSPSDRMKRSFKTKIPLFSGARCEPCYPATTAYARSVLLLYRPWHGRFVLNEDDNAFLPIFKRWIKNTELCPKVVRLEYKRAKRLKFVKEPTTKTADIDYDAMSDQADSETKDLVDLVSTIFANGDVSDEARSAYDFGLSHDWSKACVKVRKFYSDSEFWKFSNFLQPEIQCCQLHKLINFFKYVLQDWYDCGTSKIMFIRLYE